MNDIVRAAELASGTSAALQNLGVAVRAEILATAAARLLDHKTELGQQVRADLHEQSGLSKRMVDWGVQTTFETVTESAVLQLNEAARGTPVTLVAVVLAGNVFSAAVRACWIPLALGAPLIVKPSTGQSAMADALNRAWRETVRDRPGAQDLADAMQTVSFRGTDEARGIALCAHSKLLSVYGSDQTIQTWATRSESTPLLAHGHGVGAVFVESSKNSPESVNEAAVAIAQDVAAYDQRGCLSPHIVFAPAESTRALARALARQLDRMAQALPRGTVPRDAQAQIAQWRGVANALSTSAEAEVFSGRDGCVVLRDPACTLPLSPTPGYRHVEVRPCATLEQAVHRVATWGPHLKCFGVVADQVAKARAFFEQHEAPLPRCCALGVMQRPAFDAWADGHPAWHGVVVPEPVLS